MRVIPVILATIFSTQTALAWSECGHHLIAVMAFEELTVDQQSNVLDLLRTHPRFLKDFRAPENAGDPVKWLIGRAAYWPVAARRSSYARPNWIWQPGATVLIGNPSNVPQDPGPCPAGATLDSRELHLLQAIELCRGILKDKSQPAADRAVALCWICHLVGEIHQPCHAGSLYSEKLFPNGDRGARKIPTKQQKNLHNLWDGLLGQRFDADEVRRLSVTIRETRNLWSHAKDAATYRQCRHPSRWLSESVYCAEEVYDDVEVLPILEKADKDGSRIEPIELSEKYLQRAGKMARERAAFAAQRLAEVLRRDVCDPSK